MREKSPVQNCVRNKALEDRLARFRAMNPLVDAQFLQHALFPVGITSTFGGG